MKKAAMKTIADKFVFPMFPGGSAINPKPEIRNPKEARSPKSEIGAGRNGFGSSFDFRNSFGFRHSDFGVLQVPAGPLKTLRNRKLESPRWAFTLIELLVVIAIMGVLAALLFPVVGAVKKRQYINHTQAQMAQLETAIDRYKAAYGFYPPDNPGNPLTNQLYFELVGTTFTNNNLYTTLDGSAQIITNQLGAVFGSSPGVGGFVNCTKSGAVEDVAAARNFLPDLRPNQAGTNGVHGTAVKFLLSPVGGPDASYMPMGWPDVNPWRYNSSNPANNPGAYELWIKLSIGGKTNLICNWTKQVQVMTNNWLP